jgi:hypothetical protein
MSKLNETLAEIYKAARKLSKLQAEIQNKLDLVTGSFKYKYDMMNDVLYCGDNVYNMHDTSWFNNDARLWIKETSHVMSEQDYPVQLSDGKEFCEFFDLTKLETELILSKCATDEQYQEFCEYEYRNSQW